MPTSLHKGKKTKTKTIKIKIKNFKKLTKLTQKVHNKLRTRKGESRHNKNNRQPPKQVSLLREMFGGEA